MTTPPREKLTFSQAQGLEELPTPLKLGELATPVRNAIFAVLVSQVEGSSKRNSLGRVVVVNPWYQILWNKQVHFDHRPIDEMKRLTGDVLYEFKNVCFNAPFNEVLDLLEFLSRQEDPLQRFLMQEVNAVFHQYGVPYRLEEPGPSVMAMATAEEGQAVRQSFALLGGDEYSGARKHLRDAGVYLGQVGREADSVRESIHAVEAVCRVLAGKPSTTLTEGLRALGEERPLHGAFTAALEKLYGYTNDEKGIRHSLLDGEAAVDSVDAQFMFGACASFVSYLIGKTRSKAT